MSMWWRAPTDAHHCAWDHSDTVYPRTFICAVYWKIAWCTKAANYKFLQQHQLNSRKFLVFPGAISTSRRFPELSGVVDTLNLLIRGSIHVYALVWTVSTNFVAVSSCRFVFRAHRNRHMDRCINQTQIKALPMQRPIGWHRYGTSNKMTRHLIRRLSSDHHHHQGPQSAVVKPGQIRPGQFEKKIHCFPWGKCQNIVAHCSLPFGSKVSRLN